MNETTHSLIGRLVFLVLLVCLVLALLGAEQPTQPLPDEGAGRAFQVAPAKLLFASGFEEGVSLQPLEVGNPDTAYQFLVGKDSTTGFAWPLEVLGGKGRLHLIAKGAQGDFAKYLENRLETVIGPHGKPTRALHQINYLPAGAVQCPYSLLNVQQKKSDLYIKYWIKLSEDYLQHAGRRRTWRALFEWKSDGYGNAAESTGFRLIAFIYTDETGRPFWRFQGDADPLHPLWAVENREVPVPFGKWFLTEFFWHFSEGEDGLCWWKVNHRLVASHRGPTTRNSKGINFIMLFQLYGDVYPKSQWIDDLEIWSAPPSPSTLESQ